VWSGILLTICDAVFWGMWCTTLVAVMQVEAYLN
jgi:hypothetical protein